MQDARHIFMLNSQEISASIIRPHTDARRARNNARNAFGHALLVNRHQQHHRYARVPPDARLILPPRLKAVAIDGGCATLNRLAFTMSEI